MGPGAVGDGGWLYVVAAAGLAGMDAGSWPQAMVSRPVVAGLVGGWLAGDPGSGLLVGGVLELLFLRHQPYGGARCPDAGPAAVVAGAAYAGAGSGHVWALAAAAGAGWALAWIGAWTVRWHRRLAAGWFSEPDELAGEPARLEGRQRLLVAADFVRAAALGLAFGPVLLLVGAGAAVDGVSWWGAAALALAVGAAGGAGARAVSPAGSRGLAMVAGGVLAAVVAGGLL